MGNRITFDEISQKLCSIYRVTLCCFQNEIQNDSPYLVRYGQLESVIGNLRKEAADGFIRFKSLHCTQDVILHHCQSEASNLSGTMYRLAFAKVQQGLTILVCNFGSPSSGINESLSGKKVKLALLKQILVAATEALLQDRHSHEYADGGIWAVALLAFWKQRLEYLLINLGCHETIKLVMPCVGVRILL